MITYFQKLAANLTISAFQNIAIGRIEVTLQKAGMFQAVMRVYEVDRRAEYNPATGKNEHRKLLLQSCLLSFMGSQIYGPAVSSATQAGQALNRAASTLKTQAEECLVRAGKAKSMAKQLTEKES